LDTLRFGGLGSTYTIHLKFIGKVDFLIVLIELLSLAVTSKALQAKIDWKSAFCKGWVTMRQILTYKGTSAKLSRTTGRPRQSLTVFTQKNCGRFF